MEKLIRTVLPVLMGLFIFACTGPEKTVENPARVPDTTATLDDSADYKMDGTRVDSMTMDSTSFEQGVWKIVSVGDLTIPEEGNNSTIHFKEGKASGKGLCNVIQADYTLEGDSISFSDTMATTKMSCPGEFDQLEDKFDEAMKNVHSYKMEDGKLHLFYEEDKAIILERY